MAPALSFRARCNVMFRGNVVAQKWGKTEWQHEGQACASDRVGSQEGWNQHEGSYLEGNSMKRFLLSTLKISCYGCFRFYSAERWHFN